MKYLFLTGTGRSGTSLLDKLLHSHPAMSIGSQPFPYFFLNAKIKFEQLLNAKSRYPLSHLFMNQKYDLSEFEDFLKNHQLTSDDVKNILRQNDNYTGMLTKGFPDFCDKKISEGSFYDVYCQFSQLLRELLKKDEIQYLGSKEIWMEEFIPYLLTKGIKIIVIIRDPRDLICSFGHGARSSEFIGKIRPILYILRQWRKSVSFSLNFQDNPLFHWLKYEDLVFNPKSTLNSVANHLGIEAFDKNNSFDEIYDQNGSLWKGNSSFHKKRGLDMSSVGKYKEYLSINEVRYIESICFPEMKTLDYSLSHCTEKPDLGTIKHFKEPHEITHDIFEKNYSSNKTRVLNEIKRLKLFEKTNLSQKTKTDYFIYPKSFDVMKKTF